MDKLNINSVPVIDSNDFLVGMIVKSDIYRFMIHPGHYVSCPIDWVMSESIVSAQSDEDIITVSKRLRKNNISSMPVLKNNKVIGIITIEQLLDYFLLGNDI